MQSVEEIGKLDVPETVSWPSKSPNSTGRQGSPPRGGPVVMVNPKSPVAPPNPRTAIRYSLSRTALKVIRLRDAISNEILDHCGTPVQATVRTVVVVIVRVSTIEVA